MKAIVQHTYGGPDVLRLQDVDEPSPAADEVLVRVHAAGVDRGVWHVVTGTPYLMRLAGYGLRTPRKPVPGLDVAGVVEAVGADVTRFRVGDEVFGVAKGSFAELACAREDRLAPKPANLGLEQAAVVAVSGVTALRAVRDQGHVSAGQQVLVIGASGGVGTYAVQLAHAFGAEVTGVCSTEKVDLVSSLGADRVIDYRREDFAAGERRYDVILDIGGNSTLRRLRRVLTAKGTLVIVGGETGGRLLGGFDRQIRAMLLSPFVGQRLGTFVSIESAEHLVALKELIEAGKVTPVIDRSYPLAEAPDAVRYVEQGRARGKVVITV